MARYTCVHVFVAIFLIKIFGVMSKSIVEGPAEKGGIVPTASATNGSAIDCPYAKFEYINTIEGKSFFVDYTVKTGYPCVKSLCDGAGLQAVEILTAGQHNLLARALAPHNLYRFYWTSARDTQTEDQLVWDSSLRKVERFGNTVSCDGIRTAAQFYAASNPAMSHLYLTATSTLGLALCETRS